MADERATHLQIVRDDPSPAPPPAAERSDDELALLARGGDRPAFETLVRRHQRTVLAFATRFFAGQSALALDVAQDVFVDLLRALPRYRAEGRFPLYLYRFTLNRCRMAARSVRYEDRARDRLLVERPVAESPDLSAARERERRLLRAMGQLSEKHRAVLQLRFWGDLSHHEIAEVLETREGTIKSRLWNALAALREILGDPA